MSSRQLVPISLAMTSWVSDNLEDERTTVRRLVRRIHGPDCEPEMSPLWNPIKHRRSGKVGSEGFCVSIPASGI